MTPFQHPVVVAPFRRPQTHSTPEPTPTSEPTPTPAPADAAVTIRGLEKRYGPAEVLRGVDMTLRRGRVTALIGPNASGKTTIIKSLLGLVRPDAGRILFDGAEIRAGDTDYRARVGYMPQAPHLPDTLTGRQLLDLLRGLRPGAETDERLVSDLDLEGELDMPLRTRSGGTRQKVNAAAAFLFRPDVIILDEPTAGLDPLAAGALKDRVRAERGRGAAVLLTSHVTSELDELADDVVFLLDGRVRFEGTIGDLRAAGGDERLERAVAHLMSTER